MDSLLLGCRILLVEDEMMVSWALEQAIISLDCVVVGPAARISQALAMIQSRLTVRMEMLRAIEISSSVRPPKNRSSTTWARR